MFNGIFVLAMSIVLARVIQGGALILLIMMMKNFVLRIYGIVLVNVLGLQNQMERVVVVISQN